MNIITLISDNASPKRLIELEDSKIISEAKRFFKWKAADIKRVKSLGSSDYDRFIEHLYSKKTSL
jgi:hypothetical protein